MGGKGGRGVSVMGQASKKEMGRKKKGDVRAVGRRQVGGKSKMFGDYHT